MSGRAVLRGIFWLALAALWVALMVGACILLALMVLVAQMLGPMP